MDDQEWTLTWDDEDIVEDFSEILRNEKKLLRLVTSDVWLESDIRKGIFWHRIKIYRYYFLVLEAGQQ